MAAVDMPIAGGHAEDAHGDPHANYLKASHGIRSWLFTLDHKRIGLMYLTMVCIAFLVGGIFALLVRLELFSRGKTIIDGETYNRFFTLHGAVMVFLFIIPSVPGGPGELLPPHHDRREGRRVPAAQPAELLHLPRRRRRSCSRAS